MKKILLWIAFSLLPLQPLQAAGETLRVGIIPYYPPFIMQSGPNVWYGFDIDMMRYMCKEMQRTCVFIPMTFDALIPALVDDKLDVAIAAITITRSRAEKVRFSMPYLPSQSRFLRKVKKSNEAFGLQALNNRSIALVRGSAYIEQLNAMGVTNPKIKPYAENPDVIEALGEEKSIDYALIDAPTANYWAVYSSGMLETFGPPMSYGFGLGVAINPRDLALLKALNDALLKYQTSGQFEADFNKYMASF